MNELKRTNKGKMQPTDSVNLWDVITSIYAHKTLIRLLSIGINDALQSLSNQNSNAGQSLQGCHALASRLEDELEELARLIDSRQEEIRNSITNN